MAQPTTFPPPDRFQRADAPRRLGTRIGNAWHAAGTTRRVQVLGGFILGIAVMVAAAGIAPTPSVIALGLVSMLAGLAALVDVHEHRIPNALLLISLGAIVAAAAADGVRTGLDVVVGLMIAAIPLFVVRYGKGLAMGDVKFAAVLGAAGGLLHPFAGLVVVWFAALSSGTYALVRHRHRLALGPWLWAGFVAACAVGVLTMQWGGDSWPTRP